MRNMILTIDVGNTRIKAVVFEGDTVLESFVFEKERLQVKVQKIIADFPLVATLVVSSVGEVEKQAFRKFQNKLKVHFVSHEDVFPFVNNYALYKYPYRFFHP